MKKFKVIKNVKKIEKLLAVNYLATGKGLHEKATSVEEKLTPELMKKIRYIATIRNKLVHEDDFKKLPNDFLKINKEVIRELSRNKKSASSWFFYLIMLCLLVVLLYFRFRNGFS